MAKKGNGFGKLVAFATIAGAVAAGISYFTKYKSFHKELEEDFWILTKCLTSLICSLCWFCW